MLSLAPLPPPRVFPLQCNDTAIPHQALRSYACVAWGECDVILAHTLPVLFSPELHTLIPSYPRIPICCFRRERIVDFQRRSFPSVVNTEVNVVCSDSQIRHLSLCLPAFFGVMGQVLCVCVREDALCEKGTYPSSVSVCSTFCFSGSNSISAARCHAAKKCRRLPRVL